MNIKLFFLSGVVILCLTICKPCFGQAETKTMDINQHIFMQYDMPVYGLTNQADIQRLVDFFNSKEGIVFVKINPKSFYCTVITKDYITIDNVIDILRKENTKTDHCTSKSLNQQEADLLIKNYKSDK